MIDKYILKSTILHSPQKENFMIRNDFPGEYMIKTKRQTDIFIMNELAYETLTLIDGKRTINDIICILLKEYSDVEVETMKIDICILCRDLERRKIISFR